MLREARLLFDGLSALADDHADDGARDLDDDADRVFRAVLVLLGFLQLHVVFDDFVKHGFHLTLNKEAKWKG